MQHFRWWLICLLIAGAAYLPHTARADEASDRCRALGTDDTLRPLPDALAAKARDAFDLHMNNDQVARTTVYRCMNHQVLMCTTGANLPCGKAQTSRTLPAANAWCEQHKDAASIPMAVTGHATIFRWRCNGTNAVTAARVEKTDARGFIARLWRPVR